MKPVNSLPYIVSSISELHRLFKLPKPERPQVTIIDFALLDFKSDQVWKSFTFDFYSIVIKRGAKGKVKYGQRDCDFDNGVMFFSKPRQVFGIDQTNNETVDGYMLAFEADFILHSNLAKDIKNQGFFSYSLIEALHLSEKEDGLIFSLFLQLQQELKKDMDHYSHAVIISYIELLLNYSNRFYNRQFISRKTDNTGILSKFELLLSGCFKSGDLVNKGLPTVQYLSQELNISADYLTDMLRNLTGQSAQQHIHNHLIETAKELLSTTSLTVSEIAYQLGFNYPQSLSKLFKNKTQTTPSDFRQSFN